MTLATSPLKRRLSEPDNTNALTSHLAAYPVANDYINARVFDMNANYNKDKNSDSRLELEYHANMVVLGQYRYIILSSIRHA